MESTPTRSATRWLLGRRTRRAVLVVHIASAGAWIGIDVVMGVFVFTALFSDDPATQALCYQALELFAIWPLFTTGMVCLASGILLGLGTKYGLVRFWWVAVKLVLNLALNTLVLLSLRPGITEVAESGRRIADGQSVVVSPGDMVFPPIVSPTVLIIAVVLSVYKPWGRIRKRPTVQQPEPVTANSR
ncbi:MAG: hypothetical protein GEU96_08180 [Propionibacteriales bacterium]|nr:hypothetical protein [Propionibacteriales bacterium]